MKDFVLELWSNGVVLDVKGQPDPNLVDTARPVIGRKVQQVMPPEAARLIARGTNEVMRQGGQRLLSFQALNGSDVHYEFKFTVDREGKVLVFVRTVPVQEHENKKVTYLAYHDVLTDLPNRYLFNDRLRHAIAQAEREKYQLAIMFLDLDNFKQVNDTIGHKAGDQLLQGVAERLRESVRRTDTITRPKTEGSETMVARLGGDEFTLLLAKISNIRDPATVARRILNSLAEPFMLGAHEVFASASIGIAVFPTDGRDVDTLLKHADVAMYHAKESGRNNYQYYSESMNRFTLERFEIENKLRKALEGNEFMLFYQPQIEIRTGKMIGVEALIRWLQPDLVLTRPSEFIPLAEETGLIIPIGEWVLRTACMQSQAWQKAGLEPMRMTVNVSGIQFRQADFLDMVAEVLRNTRMDPRNLQLELTESTVMKDIESTVNKLHTLQDMGIRISIDDFGTGYSSLNYLKRFPLSTLKIDYSFIREVSTSTTDQSIVKAIVDLAHNFNLSVVAEGVETRPQLAFLRDRRCLGMQGHLVCPPVSSVALARFIKDSGFLKVLRN